MKILARLIQIVLICIPVGIMGWLLNQWFVPSGVFVVLHEVGENSSFIDELKPESRLEDMTENENKEMTQAIVGDPAYFFIHPHRDFKKATVEVWFQNQTLPIVEMGGLTQLNPDVYDLQPLHNRIIDESSWDRIDENGYVLLQKEKQYDSLQAFFQDPPSRDRVGVYKTTLDLPYRMEGYTATQTIQTLDVSLRGQHEFKTYLKDEPLSFSLYFMDMNRDEGEDVIRATVFNEEGLPVTEARFADDGNTSNDGVVDLGLKRLDLQASSLDEGVYKVVLNTTRDIFFRKIETTQQKVVFVNAVFVGDEVGYREPWKGAKLYTESKYLRFQTRHAEGVQTLTAGTSQVNIAQPYEWYGVSIREKGLQEVSVPTGDVEVVTSGLFAFSPTQYFNPLDNLDVDYVLAKYTSPRQEGDWLVATLSVPTEGLHAEEDGTWKFSFSTPFIEELHGRLVIHQIHAWLYR